MTRPNRLTHFAAALTSAALSGGCGALETSTWDAFRAPVPDVRPVREARAKQAGDEFERQRNRAQFLAAEACWSRGDLERCRETLEQILSRDPAHRDALLLSADVYLEQSRADEAVAVMRRAVDAYPEDCEVAYRLGLTLDAAGEHGEALHYFNQAVAGDPQNEKYAAALKESSDAKPATERDVAEEKPAVTQAAERANLSPSDVGNEPDAETTASADASPDRAEIDAAIADWEAGRKQSCRTRLKTILEKDPKHVEANILQTEVDLDAGDHDAALSRIERLVIRRPGDAQVRRACGLAYQTLGRNEQAALCFARAEELESGEASSASSQVATAAYEGPTNAAATNDGTASAPVVLPAEESPSPPTMPEFESLTASPAAVRSNTQADRSPAGETAAALFKAGTDALSEGDVVRATKLLTDAIRRDRRNSQTAVDAAVEALKQEQPALALELATLGTAQFPRSAGLHRIQGTAALRLGRHTEAEKALRQSLALDNTQALSYFLLGSVQARLGKPEAEQQFRQAARLDRRYEMRR